MYIKRIFIKDIGPLETVDLIPPFGDDGKPRPLILLGANGSGKTNVLSIIADAVFECAAQGYSDVLPSEASGRSYFRILGATTRRSGAAASLSVVALQHAQAQYFFVEKNGPLNHAEARRLLPDQLQEAVKWPEKEDRAKNVSMNTQAAVEVFENGAYCYFPSSRAEKPDWLNNSGVPDDEFSSTPRLTGRLRRPLFVESGLSALGQWILSVMFESRMDVAQVPLKASGSESPAPVFLGVGNKQQYVLASQTLGSLNSILRVILGDDTAHVVWVGRQSSTKVGIASGNQVRLLSLNSLSAGQATLLNVFGTLLRYADWSRVNEATTMADVAGICIIDEIDAHMHVELQHKAIPQLLALFPNVQFIVSCHSPLCVLGLAERFGDAVKFVNLPTGQEVDAEVYSEFENAFNVLKGTRAFSNEIAQTASKESDRLLVWLEGETDPHYLTAAAELLGRKSLLEKVEFAWIGAKEEGKQTNFHSGKDALNHTLSFLRANPGVVKRRILIVYDNDANKPDSDEGSLHVRSVQGNDQNQRVRAGIENLLPESVFTPDMFETRVSAKANGSKVTTEDLRKMALCDHLCTVKRDPEDFANFAALLEIVQQVAEPPE